MLTTGSAFGSPQGLFLAGGLCCMVHFKDAVGDTLVPAGQGQVNWAGVVKACLDADVPYGFVEQEKWDRDPYACLGEAMEWLNTEIEKARC